MKFKRSRRPVDNLVCPGLVVVGAGVVLDSTVTTSATILQCENSVLYHKSERNYRTDFIV